MSFPIIRHGQFFIISGLPSSIMTFSLWLQDINKRPMGHMAHLRKQFNSINPNDYLNVDWEKKKAIIYFMRIEWFFIWTNLNPLHQRMLCAKFGWNWPSGSEVDFQISSMYFPFFVIIAPLEKGGAFHLNKPQGCIVPSLVDIGPVEPSAQAS